MLGIFCFYAFAKAYLLLTLSLKPNRMFKVKILMVCLGNICRSPLAEGLLKSKLDPTQFEVDSVGTGHWHAGNSPDPRSVAVAKKNGLDISNLRGRQLSHQDLIDFDHIYVMDSSNLENTLSIAQNEQEKSKVSMILDSLFPGEKVDVPDPYHGLDDGFDRVYDMLNESCKVIAQQLSN